VIFLVDKKKVKKVIRDDRKIVCKMCKNPRAVIRKYNLYICRRCFKECAEKLGFRKLE